MASADIKINVEIIGYRQLNEHEAALINRAKALAEQCGALVADLRKLPATGKDLPPGSLVLAKLPVIDQRWVSIGATDLQQGFMGIVRGIAQPSSF